MDQKLQIFVNGLSQGATDTEQLLRVMHGEHEQTRQLIADAFQQQQSLQKKQEDRKAFLQTLWFDKLHSREENIVDAHRKTFEWIFDRSGRSDVPWNNFVEWLENGRGFYWINGKAGLGKSTLMSFIGQDVRVSEMLKVWSATESTLMPRYYFWSGGERLEKSVEGLLRSLLWQILNDSPDLDFLQSRYSDYRAAWTERRLRQLVQHTVQDMTRSKHLCFFIDGLDEYDGDQDGLTDLLKGLVQNSKVKICLSSRPYQSFEHAFGSASRLRLQDMTRGDIEIFTLDKLQSIAHIPDKTVQYLTAIILERAEGVFLWASLAVRDLMRGLRNGDSPKQLEERLARLPDEIDEIYERMLNQIETVYRNEASVYLQIALHGRDSSLLSHVLAVHDGLDDMLGSDEKLPELELVKLSYRARERIVTTCAGLLEISELPGERVQKSARYIPGNSSSTSSSEAHDITPDVEHTNLSSGHPATDDEDGTSSGEEQNSEKPSLGCNMVGPNDEQEGSRCRDEESVKRYQDPDFGAEPYLGDHHDEDDSRCESNRDDYDDEDEFSKPEYDGESRANDIHHIGHSINIALVHRSAVDFLQDRKKGGAFLDSHTPPTFHPQVFHVKVQLARWRLFGNWGGYGVSPSTIMNEIYKAEKQTQVAHTQLCALLDQIMYRIDGSRKQSHWSARWCGRDYKFRWTDSIRPRHLKTPQSSWKQGKGSIRASSGKTVECNILTSLQPSFLLLAASHSLLRYGYQTLQARSQQLGAELVPCLLSYCILSIPETMWIYDAWHRTNTALDLITETLDRGEVSTNFSITEDFTLWSMFLWRMHNIAFTLIFPELYIKHKGALQSAMVRTVLAFLTNNSDLQYQGVFDIHFLVSDTHDPTDRLNYYIFRLALSALSVIKSCLRGRPELESIEDLCSSRGAPHYSECLRFEVYVEYLSPDQKGIVPSVFIS